MNTLTVLEAAESAQIVLDLAVKSAQSMEDWRHVNRLASRIKYALHGIEQDNSIRDELRKQAYGLTLPLLETMRVSVAKTGCAWTADAPRAPEPTKYPEHKPDSHQLEEQPQKGGLSALDAGK